MVARDLLCTMTSESASLLFKIDIAEISILALQMYLPPWKVCSGLKVRIRVVSVPVVIELLTEISWPPTTFLYLSNHSSVGSTIKFTMTVAVQVRVYACPAVETPLEWISTIGAWSPTEKCRAVQFKVRSTEQVNTNLVWLYTVHHCLLCSWWQTVTEDLESQ